MSSGACPCGQTQDPQVVFNPPALATIAYRIDDFSGFRRALLEPREGESALLGWRPAPGDLGLQLLEWWAYLADILTFYNERIANESYLRTAQLPTSVTALVALLGYRPRPAIGAVGKLAAIRGVARPHEPVVIPAGMQLANTATPEVPVQTFETAAASFSGHSDVAIELPPGEALLTAASSEADTSLLGSVLLKGNLTSIKAGDELLALTRSWSSATATARDWAKLSVVSSAPEEDPDGAKNTRVVLDAAQLEEVEHWIGAASTDAVRLLRATQTAALWTQEDTANTKALEQSGEAELKIHLSAVLSAIAPGDLIFLDAGNGTAVGLVTEATESFLSVKYPSSTPEPKIPFIAVSHTELTVSTPYPEWAQDNLGLEAENVVVRFGLKDVGTPIGTPAQTLQSLPATVIPPAGFTLEPSETAAFVEDPTGAGIPVIASMRGDGRLALTATPTGSASPPTPAAFSLLAPLRLLIDVVDVSRGATVAGEHLGSGDASIAGQTFTLKQSPMTYLASGAEYASTLQIAVDGILWSEVSTFYAQPPDAAVFVLSQLPDATSVVRFGDGINGARLPGGSQIVASYRHGAGAARPPAGRLTTILEPQPNLAAIRNPFAVWGGADAEPASEVRHDAPSSVLTFGRAISAEDYETVAALAPSVARARAYWTWDSTSQRTLVKVYVGDDPGAAAAAKSALAGAEDPNRPVAVEAATSIELTVQCTLLLAANHVAAGVQAAAEAALTDPESGLFSPANMAIGRVLYSSQLEAALLVDGVEAVQGLTVTADGEEIFASEPIGSADPGEGSFYALAAHTITAVVGND